jgi:FYVE/RhoGEF/PH domain-containing protein 5/6
MFRQKTQSKLKSSLRQVVITGSSMSSVLSGTAQPTSAAVSVAVAAVPTSAASKRSQGIKTLRKFSAGPLLNGFHSEPKTHSISSQMNKFLVLDADMAIFFSSIDQICTLNTQLLDHLSRHYDEMQRLQDSGQEHHVHRAGAIFNAYAPLFQLYISYASRYQSALMVIESQEFLTFLKSMPEEATLRRLRRYLNMPMDRIPTYQKFLNDLIQYTTPDHLDHGPLNAAIKTVELVAKKIKEVISKQQNEVKIQEIYQKTSLDTLKGKHFVKEGMLRKVCRSKVHRYNFYLLEDGKNI